MHGGGVPDWDQQEKGFAVPVLKKPERDDKHKPPE